MLCWKVKLPEENIGRNRGLWNNTGHCKKLEVGCWIWNWDGGKIDVWVFVGAHEFNKGM